MRFRKNMRTPASQKIEARARAFSPCPVHRVHHCDFYDRPSVEPRNSPAILTYMKLTILLLTAAFGASAFADNTQLAQQLMLARQRIEREQAQRWERTSVAIYANERGVSGERTFTQGRQNDDRPIVIQQGRGQKLKVKPAAQ